MMVKALKSVYHVIISQQIRLGLTNFIENSYFHEIVQWIIEKVIMITCRMFQTSTSPSSILNNSFLNSWIGFHQMVCGDARPVLDV